MSYIGNEPISAAFLTDTFSGNGSTVAFTMTVAPANTSSILVAVTGVVQDPSTYSVSGTTLTFSAAPPSGTSNISVRYLGIPASGVTTTAYRTVTDFTATAGQTTFSVPSYTVGYIDVYRNGVRLAAADYTATNGTTVVLASAATAGDSVVTESFYVSSVLNAIPATAGAVNSTYITDSAVTTAKIDSAAVTTAKIADASVTQAKMAAGVAGNGPAFSAYKNTGQTFSVSTLTKVIFQLEEFDTASCFNNTASTVGGIPAYAFMPNVAGYYQVNLELDVYSNTSLVFCSFYKNGSEAKRGYGNNASNTETYTGCSALIYMNGTTDYLEAYVYAAGGAPNLASAPQYSYFQAFLARAA